MRILFGYNGSEASAAALADLRHAGLPSTTQVLVFSVAELWVSPRSVEAAVEAAAEAKAFLNDAFPEWTIYIEAASGSPAREILARAETFKPDMIVLGEPRQTIEDRNIFLGQTSQTVLNEAQCPVRIARGPVGEATDPERIIVGFDGSVGAMNAVRSIVDKDWKQAPEVRLLAVTDLGALTAVDSSQKGANSATVELKLASEWPNTIATKALSVLTDAGITASLATKLGHAKDAIIKEAEEWNADSIFVGPHGAANSFDRFLLGSVSAAVAARAHCSVEIVRPVGY